MIDQAKSTYSSAGKAFEKQKSNWRLTKKKRVQQTLKHTNQQLTMRDATS